MIRETASPASPMLSKRRKHRLCRLRDPHDPKHHLGHDAERALAADDDTEEVVSRGVSHSASELRDPSVGGDECRREHMVRREAVLQAVRSAGVLRDVAADGADLLRRGIGRVEVPERPDRLADVEVGHAGLDRDLLVVEVDVEDRAHSCETHHHPVGRRERAAGEAGARAARNERDVRVDARTHNLGDGVGGERQDHCSGRDPMPGQSITGVRPQRCRSSDEPVVADRGAQPLEDGGLKHRRSRPLTCQALRRPRRSSGSPRPRRPCPCARCGCRGRPMGRGMPR